MKVNNFVISFALAVITFLTRLPFRSQILYHWDSVNFALALENYDVRLHQPHPPGYILYILLGRVFNFFLHDANASLVWISVLFSVAAIVAIYALGQALFNRNVGLAAAVIAITSPLYWFHGEVALSYIVEAFFVTAIALCCFKQYTGHSRYIIPTAILLGLAGGIRQSSLVFLLPLWLMSLWPLKWSQRFIAATALGIVVIAWFGAMIYMSGSIDNYLVAFKSLNESNQSFSVLNGQAKAFVENLGRLLIFNFYAIPLGLPVLVWGVIWLFTHPRTVLKDHRILLLLVWMVPSFIFYVFFVQQPGYIFSYFPGAIIFIAYFVVDVVPKIFSNRLKTVKWGLMITGVIVAANLIFFFVTPPLLFGDNRYVFRTTTWSAIRTHDTSAIEKLNYIRENFPEQQTVLFTNRIDFRLPDFYLRNYSNRSQNDTDLARTAAYALDTQKQYLVIFDADIDTSGAIPGTLQQATLPSGELIKWFDFGNR